MTRADPPVASPPTEPGPSSPASAAPSFAPRPTGPATPRARAQRAQRRTRLRWLRRAVFSLGALAIVGGVIVAWIPRPLPVELGTVARGAMRVTIDEDGQARVKDRYMVSAPLGGQLGRIELQPGDEVKQGQVLARIVPLLPPLLDQRTRSSGEARVAGALAAKQQASLQIERAKASFELVQAESARLRTLAAKGAAAPQALDDAVLHERQAGAELESLRFAERVSEHEVAMARASLSRLRPGQAESHDELIVPAPVSGRVLKVIRESEGAVQVGTPLVELGDPSALQIVVDVLTSDAVRIKPGATATLERWGGQPLEARVRRIEPSAFTRLSALGVEEQRVNVVLDLASPSASWTALGDGYRVEAKIVAWQGQDVIKVPASAVFRHGEGWALFRVDGGVARRVEVQLGERNAHEVQLTRGVAAGAQVILHPSDRVADGTKVVGR